MDLTLSEKEEYFRHEVRDFISENLTDEMRHGQRNTTGVYPPPSVSRPWMRLLGKKGWLAPLWPVQYGGPGWTHIQRFIFESETAEADAPLVHPMGVRLAGPVIIHFGTEEQKTRFLPSIRSGETYWCQGYSEPNAGSDLASLQTTAKRDGDHYVVNGSKIWTTHAHYADMMFMLVRTSHEGRKQAGISFLLVDMKSEGISINPITSMSGEHELNQVFFDDVRVPISNRIGEENRGWDCAKYLLELERGAGLFSARLRANLRRLNQTLLGIAHSGTNPLDDPLKANKFASVCMEIDVFEMLELRMIGVLEQKGNLTPAQASTLKLRASRLRQSIAQLGVDLLGSRSLKWPSPLENSLASTIKPEDLMVAEYLNSRAFTIFGGASEIQLRIIAQTSFL